MWHRSTNLFQIPRLLLRLISLLEEHNQLQRELILRVSGSPSLTPSRNSGLAFTKPPYGSDIPKTGTTTRRRTASDVWQRTPLSETVEQQRLANEREDAASQPLDPDPNP